MSTFFGQKPKIYGENIGTFTDNGLGFLPDGQYCYVKEKLNGGLELEMSYPITGAGFDALKINATILCPINPYDNWQPFRIYSITRQQSGFIKVNAEHKAYELSGYPCLPNDDYIETAGSCSQLMTYLQSEVARTAAAIGNPAYTFVTDIVKSEKWSIQSPTDIWAVMASAAKWYGGEWKYDGTECKLCEHRGEDRHVKVQYASNLVGLQQDEIDTSYTHIMPYWTDGATTVYINNYITIAAYTEARMQPRVLILDMSQEFDTAPTQQELYDAAVAWEREDKNKPKGVEKTLKVNFVSRGQTIEYAALGDIDHVELGDDVDTSNSPLGVSGKQRCISLTYDVYRGMYRDAELGKPAETLATAEIKQSKGQRDNTVWVSVTQPTEGFISGDYWIKINNTTDRIAQGLGRYTGGKWLLLCDFGSGGVGEDIGNHSERFNDYDNNTATGNHSYLHIEGRSNTAVWGYATHLGGSDNTAQNCHTCNIAGLSNTATSCNNITLNGANNNAQNSSHSAAFGEYNTLNDASSDLVGGEHNNVTGDYNTVSGYGNTVPGNYNTVSGSSNVVSGNQNTVGGLSNRVSGARSVITGQNNGSSNSTITAYDSVVCGTGHTGTCDKAIVCGEGATLNNYSGDRIIVGNGNGANAFRVNDQGNVYASVYNTSGADYAEYFEWADGNPDGEDRRGLLVQLAASIWDDKFLCYVSAGTVEPANGDDVLGAVSSRPSVIGNAYEEHWRGKYKRDIYGDFILDENGNRQLSEEYDADREYIPRSQRQEWAAIGLLGRLIIRDNGKCQPGGYVSARQGVGVPTFKETRAMCIRRLDDKHVEVLIRG